MFVITHRVIATAFALTSFAAAIIVGVWADNPLVTILWRATLTLVTCYLVGHMVGGLAERAILEQIEAYRRKHPLPTPGDTGHALKTLSTPTQEGTRSTAT